jgi:hypothetical protein
MDEVPGSTSIPADAAGQDVVPLGASDFVLIVLLLVVVVLVLPKHLLGILRRKGPDHRQ